MKALRRDRRLSASFTHALALRSGLRCGAIVGALSLAAVGTVTQAQVLYGTITGTVTDPSGAAVPGAQIKLVNQNTGLVKEITANGAGEYDAVNLEPGAYRLAITAAGFARYEQGGATVTGNQILRVNAALRLGEAS